MPVTLPRLYAILDVDVCAAAGLAPVDVADAWLDAGVGLIQLRAKALSLGPFQALADHVRARTRAAGALLIINDRADVSALCGADGVHVGQDDLSPADVRRLVGPDAIIGLSTHADGQIAAAVGEPVDYLAIGPVFGTRTKDTGYDAVGLTQVARAASAAHAAGLTLVAIGGITRQNAAGVFGAGADSVAVISDLIDPLSAAASGRRAAEWITAFLPTPGAAPPSVQT